MEATAITPTLMVLLVEFNSGRNSWVDVVLVKQIDMAQCRKIDLKSRILQNSLNY